MTDDTSTADSTPPGPVQQEPPPPPAARARSSATPPSRRGRGAGWLALLSLILAITALAAVGWLYRQDADQREMAEFRVQSAIQAQASELRRLSERLADQRQMARALGDDHRQALASVRSQLQQQAQRIKTLDESDRTDWRAAELEYLLKLARQRLLLGGEVNTAVELLEAADQLARDMDDPDLLTVRAALASDIATLRALPTVDVEGVWLALDATARQVAQLRLVKPPELGVEQPEPAVADEGWSERLQRGLQAAVAKLSELVQIRRRDEAYQPLLAPQYEAVLRQHLALLFEQAQLALLSRRPELYRQTLGDATHWVETYFALDEASTRSLVERIAELRQRTVRVEPPDIATSLRAMRDYQQEREGRRQSAAGPTVPPPSTSAGGQVQPSRPADSGDQP